MLRETLAWSSIDQASFTMHPLPAQAGLALLVLAYISCRSPVLLIHPHLRFSFDNHWHQHPVLLVHAWITSQSGKKHRPFANDISLAGIKWKLDDEAPR